MKFVSKSIVLFLGFIGLGTVHVLCTELPAKAQTLIPDVGLITRLSGDAIYWNEGFQKTPEKVQAFMKIRCGDHLKIAAGAMVQLVYFQNGRQETWKGPAALIVDEVQSRVEGEKELQVQPEVSILPTEASQGMRRIPALLRRAELSRSGGMLVRGAAESTQKAVVPSRGEQAEIVMAKEAYQKLRKQTKADDITPELSLLGVLADYEQYEEMERVVKDALKIQPNNEVLEELEEWVRTRKLQPLTGK
jgi:hypothetical protein